MFYTHLLSVFFVGILVVFSSDSFATKRMKLQDDEERKEVVFQRERVSSYEKELDKIFNSNREQMKNSLKVSQKSLKMIPKKKHTNKK